MVERKRVDSARIAPSAHYTGHVWFHHRLAEPALATVFGRWVHSFVMPVNWGTQLDFRLNIEGFLLQGHLMIDAHLTQAVEREGVVRVVEMACRLSPRGRRLRRHYPQLRYLEAGLPPMAARKAALLRDQGWSGPGHTAAVVSTLAEDGERSLTTLLTGSDCECPLVAITEGLINYFQRPVIEAFWSRLATELKHFPQGIYLTDLYPDLREHSYYRQIRWGMGIIGRLTQGSYPLHYRSAAGIEAAFARCGFAPTLVLGPQRKNAALGLPQGRLPNLVRMIESRTVQPPFRRPPLAARRRGGRLVRRQPPDRSAGR